MLRHRTINRNALTTIVIMSSVTTIGAFIIGFLFCLSPFVPELLPTGLLRILSCWGIGFVLLGILALAVIAFSQLIHPLVIHFVDWLLPIRGGDDKE